MQRTGSDKTEIKPRNGFIQIIHTESDRLLWKKNLKILTRELLKSASLTQNINIGLTSIKIKTERKNYNSHWMYSTLPPKLAYTYKFRMWPRLEMESLQTCVLEERESQLKLYKQNQANTRFGWTLKAVIGVSIKQAMCRQQLRLGGCSHSWGHPGCPKH